MRSNAKSRWVLLALSLSLPAAGVAVAASAEVTQIIQTRQADLKSMGGAFKAINDQLHLDAPDLGVIRAAADKVNGYAGQLPTWFPAGSGPDSGVATHAKAEIWTDPAGFAASAKTLQDEAAKLDAVVKGTDVAAIKAQVQATGEACAGCHKIYREKVS